MDSYALVFSEIGNLFVGVSHSGPSVGSGRVGSRRVKRVKEGLVEDGREKG